MKRAMASMLLFVAVFSAVPGVSVQDARGVSIVGVVEPSASVGLDIQDIGEFFPFDDGESLMSEGLRIGTWSVSCNCERILVRCVHDGLRPVGSEGGGSIPYRVRLTTDSCGISEVAEECFLLSSFSETGVHVADAPVDVLVPESWYRDARPDSFPAGRYRLDVTLVVETY